MNNEALEKAETLDDAYVALGKPLPPTADRATEYARLGLGEATLYSGTAEQNAKYLAALKAEAQK